MIHRKMVKALSLLGMHLCSTLSLAYTAEITIIGDDPDNKLRQMASIIALSRGEGVPQGWKVKKEEFHSQIIDNVDASLDKENFATIPEIKKQIKKSINNDTSCSLTLEIQKILDEEIKYNLRKMRTKDLGVEIIYYRYTKVTFLTKDSS